MKSLSVDIETYSSVDLAKSGVCRYVESPDFEILLFGYAVDGGEVIVVDLANGEKIPNEILNALTDDTVIKWAYNANFERICISRFLFNKCSCYLNPVSWRCSMVWASTLGLPRSLEGVGAVLGLDKQKLTEGKELIRYFCVPCAPTKSNGGRTRNRPSDAPDKWERFKAYNLRDVQTEESIRQRLSGFPVSDEIWDEYRIDQEINDRGIAVDAELVRQAIEMDNRSRAELISAMKELTDLDNPNSVQQMKQWLSLNGLKVDSLGKKEVAEMIKTVPPELQKILTLRQQLAKSSVKKYTAMQNAVCADGRARGMFQFLGANRTGRWCLTGDHEVLTDAGWRRLDEWKGGKIACWSPQGEIVSFQDAKSLSFPYQGIMYKYDDKRISQISTPEHKMYIKKRYSGEWQEDTVENMEHYRPSIPFTGYRTINTGMECNKLRVMIMIQADGHYTTDGSIKLGFTKERKSERCKQLLRSADIQFIYRVFENNSKPRHQFTILSRNVPLWLRLFKDKTFDTWLFNESADVFFDELQYWDGYRSAVNSIQYSTCNKKNADLVQAFAHMTGRSANIKIKDRRNEHPDWSIAYYVDIWLAPGNCHEIRNKPEKFEFNGTVYCAETRTGYFLVRRNGRVWVTGNSGRLIQLQNLPQNHLPDLAQARALVRSGDYDAVGLLYGDVPDTLSQLIRTALVPQDGKHFIVSDFSAIEARVIAWLAGEQWVLDAFKNGADIYCETASRMFGVTVEKHGLNNELRQKGKQATLSCSYGGSVGALKAMGAIESGMQESELQPLVNSWRDANPNIVRLWWDVDRCVKEAVRHKTKVQLRNLTFEYRSGMLFITLPSGRKLVYVKPRIELNDYGGESVTYEGVGGTKKWERLESYGPKFVENIVQGIARDILCFAMKTLRSYDIVASVHDEIIIEANKDIPLAFICEQMGRTPPWAEGLLLRADGYVCDFYKKD